MARRICEAVRDAREASGLTQRRLADMLGVSQPTVHDWERDREPTLDQIVQLEEAFELRRGDLLRLAGYVADAVPTPEQAIRADRSLKSDARQALLGVLRAYRSRGDL